MSDTNADQPLVVVFHAEAPELLPLAEGALQQEGIAYLVRSSGTGVPVGFGHPPEFGGAEGAADIYVNAGDEEKARAVLTDLALAAEAAPGTSTPAPPPAAVRAPAGPRAFRLTEIPSGTSVGEITEEQLERLIDELEEESSADQDYYIDAATIDLLESAGADAELVGILRRALGTRDGMDISWSRL